MPKKHTPTFAKPQGSVHPSLESRSTASTAPAAPKTVNDRINQLRREQAPRATAQRRNEIIDVVTQRTVPPALRHILNIPEIDPPRPKAGRPQRQVRTRRPPPGPAPPASWLNESRHAPDVQTPPAHSRQGISKFGSLATIKDGERVLPRSKSLIDQGLRTLASNWHWLAEFEQHYLAAFPVHIKEQVLSYLSVYGPEDSPDLKTFKLLFLNETEIAGGTGSITVKQLDLTGLLNDSFTLSDLNRYMSRPRPLSDVPKLPPATSKPTNPGDDVAESWEDEIDSPTLTSIQSLRFPNLTRLSLAHPGNQASWSALLAACSNLKHLTHLSLAYWPTPSTTPNAATTSMVSKHAKPVALGGSHFYSQLDDDWHEAANILRRLSIATYHLRWLDLEGCDWYKALTWGSSRSPVTQTGNPRRPTNFGLPQFDELNEPHANQESSERNWTTQFAIQGPDWNGAWKRVETLVLSQGWVPNNISLIQSMPAGALSVSLLRYLRAKEEKGRKKARAGSTWSLNGSFGKLAVTPLSGISCEHWMEKEKDIRNIEVELRLIRKKGSGLRLKVLYGWGEGEDGSEDERDD